MTTPPFAKFNAALSGEWFNTDLEYGYRLYNRRAVKGWLWRVKMVYDFAPIWDHPLLFKQNDGTCIMAGPLPGCDQGSTPPASQGWFPKDGLLAYYIHDYPFRYGGLFFRYPNETKFTFRQITRREADDLLRASAQTDPVAPAGRWRAWFVFAGVRFRVLLEKVGARNLWHEWKPGDGIPTFPTDDAPDVDPAGGYGGGGA